MEKLKNQYNEYALHLGSYICVWMCMGVYIGIFLCIM